MYSDSDRILIFGRHKFHAKRSLILGQYVCASWGCGVHNKYENNSFPNVYFTEKKKTNNFVFQMRTMK